MTAIPDGHIDDLAAQDIGVDEYPHFEHDPGGRVIVRIEPEHGSTP